MSMNIKINRHNENCIKYPEISILEFSVKKFLFSYYLFHHDILRFYFFTIALTIKRDIFLVLTIGWILLDIKASILLRLSKTSKASPSRIFMKILLLMKMRWVNF